MKESLRIARIAQIAAVLVVLLGCGSKGAVRVTARIDSPAIGVAPGPLVTTLSGGFELVVTLGDLAPRATSIQLGAFAVRRDDSILVESLRLSASESFPLALEPGGDRTVRFSIEPGETVEEELGIAICSGTIRISGTLSDTLEGGRPMLAESALFAPSCP